MSGTLAYLDHSKKAAGVNPVWLIFLLFVEMVAAVVPKTFATILAHITPLYLPHYSLTSLFFLTAVPHRAYPLSCSLLE
ncbi:MAG: hypothetical protein GY796_32470 [Chloroflexi bacterium]|nr:hypothetical protein [Chloroflexota bacterium]